MRSITLLQTPTGPHDLAEVAASYGLVLSEEPAKPSPARDDVRLMLCCTGRAEDVARFRAEVLGIRGEKT